MVLKGSEIGEFDLVVIKPFLNTSKVHIGDPRQVVVNRVDNPCHHHPHFVLSTTSVHRPASSWKK